MGKFIELPGVKTWYEVEGNGDPLLLLHAMFCTNETWGAQRPDLSAAYQVFLPERRAHGHTGDVAGPLSYHDMTSDTIDFLTLAVAKPAHLVGFSDGAIVGLLVAIARPDLVRKLVVIGGNFDVSGLLPEAYAMFDGMTPDDPHLATLSRLTGGVNRFGRKFPRRSGKSEEGAYVRVEEGIACRAAARTDR